MNSQIVESDDMIAADFAGGITIVNAVVDHTMPQLLNLTAISPLVLNMSDESSVVYFEVVVQDDLSGIDQGHVRSDADGYAAFLR